MQDAAELVRPRMQQTVKQSATLNTSCTPGGVKTSNCDDNIRTSSGDEGDDEPAAKWTKSPLHKVGKGHSARSKLPGQGRISTNSDADSAKTPEPPVKDESSVNVNSKVTANQVNSLTIVKTKVTPTAQIYTFEDIEKVSFFIYIYI